MCAAYFLPVLLYSLLFSFHSSTSHAAERDFLAQENVSYAATDSNQVLTVTAEDLKSLFERYQPALGRSSRIVVPPQVTGAPRNPNLQMTLHKCVLVICKTVALDADIEIHDVPGNCQRNMLLTADLTRSGPVLSKIYDGLEVAICLNHNPLPQSFTTERAILVVEASAKRAPSYVSGPVQRADFDLLKLQIRPMIQALTDSLSAHGAQIQ